MLTILIVLLVIFLLFGGYSHTRNWGYVGWSPVGVILVALLVLWLIGALR